MERRAFLKTAAAKLWRLAVAVAARCRVWLDCGIEDDSLYPCRLV